MSLIGLILTLRKIRKRNVALKFKIIGDTFANKGGVESTTYMYHQDLVRSIVAAPLYYKLVVAIRDGFNTSRFKRLDICLLWGVCDGHTFFTSVIFADVWHFISSHTAARVGLVMFVMF